MPPEDNLEKPEDQKTTKPAQETAKPEDDKDPEGTVLDAKGQKVAPLAALHEERAKRRELSKEVEKLKKDTARIPALEEYIAKAEPVIAKLRERPDLVQQLDKGPSKPGTDQPADDPEAEEFAKEFGFFTDGGEPDVKRAQRVLQKLEARAEKIADSKVRKEVDPLRATSAIDRSASLRERAKRVRDDSNRLYARPEHIDKVFDTLGPELTSDENVARLALVMARGLGGQGQSVESEPLLSEPAGGRRAGSLPMSPLEEKAAATRGITTDNWKKMRDNPSEVLE